MEQNCGTAVVFETFPGDVLPASGPDVARPIHVLVVEDDPDAAELVRIRLTEDVEDPFRVEWSANLFDAMNRLTDPGVDVILLDLGLPELTGYRSYRAIEAAAGHRIPVVIFTSDDRDSIRQMILEFGASDYLVKGECSPARLRRALRLAVLRSGRDLSPVLSN